ERREGNAQREVLPGPVRNQRYLAHYRERKRSEYGGRPVVLEYVRLLAEMSIAYAQRGREESKTLVGVVPEGEDVGPKSVETHLVGIGFVAMPHREVLRADPNR